MVKIYTKTGDLGETGLFDGTRVQKDVPRVEAYGDVDELNALLGVILSFVQDDEELRTCLLTIQRDLFALGAQLADPSARVEAKRGDKAGFSDDKVTELEDWIDQFESYLEPLRQFILPGGSKGGSALHHARTVCRRAERRIVSLSQEVELSSTVIRYINRLSDFLFVTARVENMRQQRLEIPW